MNSKFNPLRHSMLRAVRMIRRSVVLSLLLMSASVWAPTWAQTSVDDNDFWSAAARPDTFLMMRHALAPGNGDPVEVVIGDCSTQRNLSEEGRQQARDAGDLLRLNGITAASVYSSQWCRCMETAELLGFDQVAEMPSLNSFYGRSGLSGPQTQKTQQWLMSLDQAQGSDKPVILLVTHQVNITALTDVFPASGEMLAVQRHNDGKLEVVARLQTR